MPQTTVEIFNLAEGSSQAISLKGVLNEAGFRVLQSVHRGKDVSGILAGYKKSVAELLIICLSRGIEYVPEQGANDKISRYAEKRSVSLRLAC